MCVQPQCGADIMSAAFLMFLYITAILAVILLISWAEGNDDPPSYV